MKIFWSPLSLDRVAEVAEFISQDKLEAARQWVLKIFKKVRILERFPASGHVIPETRRQDIRELAYPPYRIIYRIQDDRISILTIRHGRQIFPSKEALRLAELGGTEPGLQTPPRQRSKP